MTDWQITAKTIYCNSVRDEITIIVKKDWSTQCTGHIDFTKLEKQARKGLSCDGLECSQVSDYLAQLKQEENI